MERFPHLKFIENVTGKPRFFGGGQSEISKKNRDNRKGHSNYLSQKTNNITRDWLETVSERENQNLAPLEEEIIPIFLQINPDILTPDFDLQKLGIEIISEEDEGFIIGASLDGLRSLEEKINEFIDAKWGSGKIADLWRIIDGKREEWKPKHILSEELYSKWEEIENENIFILEVGIAFDKPLGEEPDPEKQGGEKRLIKYRQSLIKRDELRSERETHFENFVRFYGKIRSSFIDLDDSFSCEIEINGKGLKDLVYNYPFVFEISEIEEIGGVDSISEEGDLFKIEAIPPEDNAPEIAVIDSGIMEEHKYIAPAIVKERSKSYVDTDNSTADYVKGGGHGTRVAGAVLYPNGISNVQQPYQLPCFVRNLKILDRDNKLVNQFPAELMKLIVEENLDCKIFNMSLNSKTPHRKKHMSSWAAMIDTLIHEKGILFLVSTGNINKTDIRDYLNNNIEYPEFLHKPFCRLANPAQSSFALTVGSINHAYFEDDYWKSLGNEFDISAFSRIGTGMWGKIKPDVVEFGGGLIFSKDDSKLIKENEQTAPELIRSTLSGGSAYGKDCVGTSFATPKVTHIIAQLLKLYPNEDINLLRALVIQGARLPKGFFENPTTNSIRYFGYGLPSLERVTKNSEKRITFYSTGFVKAEEGRIYSLKIPESLRGQADEYDILIEVTLAYTAKVRRTRQKTKSYLSTWLDWISSRLDNESLNDFKIRTMKEIDGKQLDYEKKSGSVIQWKIRENKIWGTVDNINRNNSTVQKDWAIIKSYNLPEELCFAVRGHKGWDKNKEQVPYAIVVSIEVLNASIEVYEAVRIENKIEIAVRT